MTRLQIIALKLELAKLGKKLSANSKVFREYKKTLKGLTPLQYQTGVGLILGDVRIELNKSGTGALLKFEWGDVHKDYAFHVFDVFEPYCLTPPRKQVRVNANGNEVVTWCFQTLTHEDFLVLAKLFLNEEGKKVVPEGLITDHLTAIGLAYWFMDDGGMAGRGIQLHTQGFSIEEVDTMIEELRAKWALDCWRGKNKGLPVINFSAHSYDLFFSLTDPYIIPSMKHKMIQRRRSGGLSYLLWLSIGV